MRYLHLAILLLSTLLLINSCSSGVTEIYPKRLFNSSWKFKALLSENDTSLIYSTKELDDSNWDQVTLPHSAKTEPLIVNNQWQGVCWYRKDFTISDSLKGRKLFLEFEGAMNIAEVWINGVKKIKHYGGYLPFVIEFSDEAIWGKSNTVAVRLDNSDCEITGPKPLVSLDFNMYGGIYRNVWFFVKNPLHISNPILANKKASGGIFVRYPEVSKEKALIAIQTHITNESQEIQCFRIEHQLFCEGKLVLMSKSEKTQLSQTAKNEFVAQLELKDPKLWSPQTPNLYTLQTSILQNNKVVDRQNTRIGIKTVAFNGQQLLLNGEPTFLRGVNRHQEYPYIGYALSDNAQYRDAKKIKDAGFDYVRLSHYPQSESFMNGCDELGIVTINAILGWQYYREEPAFKKHVFNTSRDLIRRDRNHASVIAWEVSLNESQMPKEFIDSLHTIAHEEYPGDQCFSAGWQEYGFDIYLQARQHRLQHYPDTLKKPYVVSEYGDWEYYAMNAGLNQDSWGDLLQANRSSRQLRSDGEVRLLQQATNIQEAHNDNFNTPAFADGYWVMYDYNRGYSNNLEASGIMSIHRLPKFSYYFFQSQRDASEQSPLYKSGPMVKIASWWTKESPLNVRVFSNCDEVELFLNGKTHGVQPPDRGLNIENLAHPPFTFSLNKFEKGELVARGFINGTEVCADTVKTPGEPKAIELEVDYSGKPAVSAHSDVLFVYAKITDENGTVVPVNGLNIQFSTTGNAQLVGPAKVATIAGISTVVIRIGKSRQATVIKAKSGDMESNIEIK